MIELDLSAQIAEVRSTFSDIRAVVDVDKLKATIAELSEQASASRPVRPICGTTLRRRRR
jgi:peptide chain release factor 2